MDDLVQYRLENAGEKLESAKLLMDIKLQVISEYLLKEK